MGAVDREKAGSKVRDGRREGCLRVVSGTISIHRWSHIYTVGIWSVHLFRPIWRERRWRHCVVVWAYHLLHRLCSGWVLRHDIFRSSMSCSLISLFDCQNPLFPTLLSPQSINPITALYEFNNVGFNAGPLQQFKVLCQRLDTFEASYEGQENISLAIHVLSHIDILAQIVDREVILELHCNHCHDRHTINVRIVRPSTDWLHWIIKHWI